MRFGGSMRSSTSRRKQRGITLVEMLIVIGIIVFLIALLLPAARRSIEAGRQVVCLNHMRQIAQAALMYCHDNDGTFPGICGVDPEYGGPLSYEWIYADYLYNPPFNDATKSPIMRYLGVHTLGGTSADGQRLSDLSVLRCPSDDWDSHSWVSHPSYGPYKFSYAINAWTASWQPGFLPGTYYPVPAMRLVQVKIPSQTIFFFEEQGRFIDDGTFNIMIRPVRWSESVSYAHDVNRSGFDPPNPQNAGFAPDQLDNARRTNVVFCDGHGEFVTEAFANEQMHYDPRFDPATSPTAP
ncbi:MAG TPA: DUF1559 domain-containing protein [Tepidisphaeraceae bacterium]